ncbi:30S ribosomal protein S21 [bacterium (Candidatus Gribaldobacteria) CG07_land_8_20_14_0_80_33_18]|uniref:30S ribosomal protein S21 n=1 Tax=bacterium (Candidatus Gribaldobacteria) CG07_land_8_20_14_0_80_33_18 TaxID=2014272 RepID=A0A2M6Z326_9BACT|nr:MAG: 30S ribosomal protein S21 [bacterium (Candidatus Gribaldobacteria) CG07_land_8_20_14_0_80_33_18]PJB08281.1 MAG: 30S ribosomal protein S21 [bacterium (Candidatus Gribaldobacteria) CG_4_9_14_3_um_filter_33_9]
MMVEVRKQGRESSVNVIRRFTQKVRRSGILFEIRKRRFKTRPKSHNLIKKAALIKEKNKKKYEQLKKLGKL